MSDHQNNKNNGNILIVDDTPENIQVLSATLNECGYKVRGITNGKMALRAIHHSPPDLILLDIRMPEMNGYEVCQQLKADPQTEKIPVIFISASDEVFDKVQAFGKGGVDYITKPFQIEEVIARVEHQLTIRRLQQQLLTQNQQLEQEIIERKKAEQAAFAASTAKTQFLANMSHELRTPLNSILGFAQVLIRESSLTNDQLEYLRIINRSGEHLLELINDILDLSKIEAGIIGLYETSFDLYRLTDNLEEMFQLQAEKKQLHLNFILDSHVPQYIKTDEKKLRASLINLLGNAIKFTHTGSVTLRVSKETLAPNNHILSFEIQDTGTGIAPAEMANLFQAFVQTESGQKAAEGTGLGLTITRKFIEIIGGQITVNSSIKKGTTFKFYIPLQEANPREITNQIQRRVIGIEPTGSTYRILVVDDSQENRLLLLKLLQPVGFEVKEAENGSQAISIWETWQPHLIWMDTRMPVMSGTQATREIRLKEKQTKFYTTIIALTASAFEEHHPQILAAGCNDFIRKPFIEDIIFEKIAQYLDIRYIYQELPQFRGAGVKKRNSTTQRPDSFFLPLLAQMPQPWVKQLYQAANEVNEDLIAQLINQIPKTAQILAEALKELLEDFRLDILVRLTKTTIDSW
ncbi:response regulator [Ancylothrix sp. C2]|uniref:response regulator n=1 Tax=Ancylothrix sp. D3o TaxID=2953691 RepID=UPI0021BB27C2|nr:response regulator [Ancylothrix sp. D3o]MCT7951750.1 response regulator [Ancylothrix sp. D3o]